MSLIDLHTHTTASDGAFSPEEVVRLSAGHGVRLLAITDHDSTESVRRAIEAGKQHGITVIPGIELNTDVPGGEVHVLGYFLNLDYPGFQDKLLALRDSRFGRAQMMVEKLNGLGLPVSFERVREIAGDAALGRPHVAQAMVEAGHVGSMAEAFEKYLGRNGPAYAEHARLTPAEAVRLIKQVGGLAVLAHPSFVENVEETVKELAGIGLTGIEVYYRGYTPEQIAGYLRLAEDHGLFATGGTDFHGTGNWPEDGPGTTEVPWSVAEGLFAAANQTAPALP